MELPSLQAPGAVQAPHSLSWCYSKLVGAVTAMWSVLQTRWGCVQGFMGPQTVMKVIKNDVCVDYKEYAYKA